MTAVVILLAGTGCSTNTTTEIEATSVRSTPAEIQPTDDAVDISHDDMGSVENMNHEETGVEVSTETNTGVKSDVKIEVKADVSATEPVTAAASVKEFTVSGSNMKFEPATMKVKKGDKVMITFKNVGGFHDFVLDEFNVATKRLNAGAEEVVEFTADKAGTFEYYCSVGSHRAMGMKGTLTVE